jgi:hypothetical protein
VREAIAAGLSAPRAALIEAAVDPNEAPVKPEQLRA